MPRGCVMRCTIFTGRLQLLGIPVIGFPSHQSVLIDWQWPLVQ